MKIPKNEQGEVARRYDRGESCAQIAETYDCSPMLVWKVIRDQGVNTRSGFKYKVGDIRERPFAQPARVEMKVLDLKKGKVQYTKRGHPKTKWVSAARQVAGGERGRPLARNEVVRYRDGDYRNLDPNNLVVRRWKRTKA